jgi:hypothetical protein
MIDAAVMDIPFNMTAPKLKLEDGETIQFSAEGLRRKGIFGNRFGELHVTNQRVAFVKAIMKGVIAAAVNAKGAKPMITFDRKGVTAEKVVIKKKLNGVQLTAGGVTEKIQLADDKIDALLAALAAS